MSSVFHEAEADRKLRSLHTNCNTLQSEKLCFCSNHMILKLLSQVKHLRLVGEHIATLLSMQRAGAGISTGRANEHRVTTAPPPRHV